MAAVIQDEKQKVPCKFINKGCKNGDNCKYSHSGALQEKPTQSSKPCRNFINTRMCPFGDKCYFVHPIKEEQIPTPIQMKQTPEPIEKEQFKIPSNFKTVMCKFFINGKECPFGSKCYFAHGIKELRELTTKTVICLPCS